MNTNHPVNSRFTLSNTQRSAMYLLATLLVVNASAWVWAFVEFKDNAALLGMAFLAYSFGLRHAVDADHIAAIDNVTRKLMQQGKKPISVGTYFSLGHSTIVVLASLAIAATALAFQNDMAWFHDTGSVIGTIVSSLFLLLFALVNFVILISVYRKFRQVKAGKIYAQDELNLSLENQGGLLTRIFKSAFNMVNKSWQMYFVGFLFGLGFDTATEVGVLGISAASATHGMNLWSIMVFPVLFAAGMALIDSLDNFVMIGAYGWAFSHPVRKLYYNITITGASVIIALFIGGVEGLGLISEKLNLHQGGWRYINQMSDNLGTVGYWVIGLFILFWIVSAANYYIRGYDNLSVNN
ncbi:HoxN/HupN/NixA family nickel/cobalt transporter [Salmonella enterica subsp. enterica serovar Montevideo]|nr:HoxN/HupN/NixA family nickel/cobalt transporter [Salmonella enterica subsp. enterica serovar Montevideo]EEK7814083.1 HoxN/HupN/NixA family nickel/cobalt transporter [Salmonella enterica subsp. enterica serovar Montevideo]